MSSQKREAAKGSRVNRDISPIPDQALVRLVLRIRNIILRVPASTGLVIGRVRGKHNMIHVVQVDDESKLVIRAPITGYGEDMTATDSRTLDTHLGTMRLIRDRTTIPIPEIYYRDIRCRNEIGTPFVCTSFMPGVPISRVWSLNVHGTDKLEELRHRILTSLANSMAQFAKLTFETAESQGDLGSLVGPCLDLTDKDQSRPCIEPSGPFESTAQSIEHLYTYRNDDTPWTIAEELILKTVLPWLAEPSRLVLCPPDLDSRNVLVDEGGTVTGIVDWDLVESLPRSLGFSCYPGWIMCDVYPLTSSWPGFQDASGAGASSERYRKYYTRKLGESLDLHDDWKLTTKSRIAKGVWVAVLNPFYRPQLCVEMIQACIVDESNVLDVMYDIGEGNYPDDHWEFLEEKLKEMVVW